MEGKIRRIRSLLPNTALSMLTGKLLGDGNMAIQKTRQPRFRFLHTTHDKEWCFYCYEQLKSYLPLSAPKYSKTLDTRVKQGFTESFYVQSYVCEEASLLKELWYPDNKKKLPFELIENHLNPLCLAWWYQDDGHLNTQDGKPKKIILSTDSFTEIENQTLIQIMKQRFHLTFSLDSQNRLLLYDQSQIYYFLSIVKPFIHQSMYRKIHISFQEKTFPPFKRTTIYLPYSLQLNKPTQDIYDSLKLLPMIYSSLSITSSYHQLFNNVFRSLFPDKRNVKGYQIRLNRHQMVLLDKCQKITGLQISQLVHLCFIRKKSN
ncbi:endonuclease [Bacillus songklensis]|uniref:Endonuclease n=1 Tax=Bacillus songklensis TaxID=1069116 RepID=A0ABV8B874_9BACI